jgi:hypothetical protein
MTVPDWLRTAVDDARRRGLPELEPLLQGLAKSTAALREAERLMNAEDAKSQALKPADPGGASRE